MRHGKKFNHLGRTSSHRKAMMGNMASSLILHKRITTTLAKAKALRKYVEPLITKSKTDSTHSRRVVFSYLQDKTSAQVLFNEVATKVGDRPGGYTRIIKLGNRQGDDAEMCLIELVDFNEMYTTEKAAKRTRRSRRGGKKGDSETDTQTAAQTSAPVRQTQQAEEAQVESPQEEPQTEESQAAAAPEQEVEASSADTETEKRVDDTTQDESDQKDSAQDESNQDDSDQEDPTKKEDQ